MKNNAEDVTQEMFDRLPGLLSPATMRLVTGLDDRDLKALHEVGTIDVFKLPARKGRKASRCKYYKRDAAKLMGFRL
jgi:hypothetical protein